MNRKLLFDRLKNYNIDEISYIQYCFEILRASDSENLSNKIFGSAFLKRLMLISVMMKIMMFGF